MNHAIRVLAAVLLAWSAQAGAVSSTSTGNLAHHNDVSFVPLALAQEASGLAIWTDSYRDGTNVDPIIALWRDGALLGQNDDFPYVDAAQTRYDSGLYFASLPAGSYQISITPFSNFARGPRLEDGFDHAGETPRALANGYWQLHLADGMPLPVPEPSPAAMLVAGAVLLAGWRRTRKHIGAALPRGRTA